MRELSFVGLSADGRHLLLVATDSSEYSLRVDDRLAIALRRESDRLRGQPADLGPMPKNPSPREIQDRVRAGMSVGAIASAAGVTESAISRFASAVLAERAYVAEQACQAPIRFRESTVPLGEAVDARLKAADIEVTQLRWDAWRRHDGDWTVICAFPFNQGERVATFVYDPIARRALPDDDDARWIIEEPSAAESQVPPTPLSGATAEGSDEVSKIPSRPSVLRTARNAGSSTAQDSSHRGWDSSHPAARAQQRREQAGNGPVQREPFSRRDSPSTPSGLSTSQPSSPPTSPPRSGGWEDLLLGSTGDFGDEDTNRS